MEISENKWGCISQDYPEKQNKEDIYKENCYQELTHRIKEKSQDLQLASWRCKREDDVNFSPKASRFKTQEESIFQFKSKGRKDGCSNSAVRQAKFPLTQPFCYILVFD